MLTLYHAPLTRSTRVRWLLEELGDPFELREMDFMSDERAKPEFRKLSPEGRLPVLVDGDFVLLESTAIIEYILETRGDGKFLPDDPKERATMRRWMHWGEATLLLPADNVIEHEVLKPEAERVAAVAAEGRVKFAACLKTLDDQLATTKDKGGFVVGELSAADFVIMYGVLFASVLQISSDLSNVEAYYTRIASRPKFQAAMGDSFQALERMAEMLTG